MRGTLEVYHAFIRDLDASDTSSSTNNEPDWELVSEGETESDVETVAHAQVCFKLNFKIIQFHKRNIFIHFKIA